MRSSSSVTSALCPTHPSHPPAQGPFRPPSPTCAQAAAPHRSCALSGIRPRLPSVRRRPLVHDPHLPQKRARRDLRLCGRSPHRRSAEGPSLPRARSLLPLGGASPHSPPRPPSSFTPLHPFPPTHATAPRRHRASPLALRSPHCARRTGLTLPLRHPDPLRHTALRRSRRPCRRMRGASSTRPTVGCHSKPTPSRAASSPIWPPCIVYTATHSHTHRCALRSAPLPHPTPARARCTSDSPHIRLAPPHRRMSTATGAAMRWRD